MMTLRRKLIAAVGFALAAVSTLNAQGFVGSVELTKSLPNHFSISAEGEYRTLDGMDHTDRWAVEVGVAYKPVKFLKVAAGYKFMQQQTLAGETKSGLTYPRYWVDKHRAYIGAQGEVKLFKHLSVSLRERYQFTNRPDMLVPRFLDSEPMGNKHVYDRTTHVLRSRLELEYSFYKKCRFTPFASAELFSTLSSRNNTTGESLGGDAADKWRFTAGCAYRINKQNSVELFYRYNTNTGGTDADDDAAAHLIGVTYSLKF
jgi:hypothetical protein